MSQIIIDPIKHFAGNNFSIDSPAFLIAEEKDLFAIGKGVFRSYFSSVFYVRKGKADFKVGSHMYTVEAGDVATVGPGLPYQWANKSGLAFDFMVFNENVFGKGFDKSFFYMLDYFCPDSCNIMSFDEDHRLKVSVLMETLKSLKSNQIAIPGILHALLMLLQEQYNSMREKSKTLNTGKEVFVSRFRALLAEHYASHKSVSFYASILNITPKYLSEILLEETGWSAKKWIEYHLMVEAKTMLNYSKLPIKEVAYQLGYQDVSHFTKTFKKWTQITPGAFAI